MIHICPRDGVLKMELKKNESCIHRACEAFTVLVRNYSIKIEMALARVV